MSSRWFDSAGLTCGLALTLPLLASCGPITSTARIMAAQVQIDVATRAQADKYALYEISRAREYLHKAREEQAYSDFEVAAKFADQAIVAANAARTTAQEHPTEAPAPTSPLQGAPVAPLTPSPVSPGN